MNKYVAYFRVSTAKQGKSGLGIEAQENATGAYLEKMGGISVGTFADIESGTKDDRPELQKALRICRLTGATLLIAKLDRLSRNRRFLLELQDSNTKFVCCDMPEANNFTVGLLACLADYERELISERTRMALDAAKARGVKLGNPNLAAVRNTDTKAATKARIEKTNIRNTELRQVIEEIKGSAKEKLSFRQVANQLNQAGYSTSRGKRFHATTVKRVLES